MLREEILELQAYCSELAAVGEESPERAAAEAALADLLRRYKKLCEEDRVCPYCGYEDYVGPAVKWPKDDFFHRSCGRCGNSWGVDDPSEVAAPTSRSVEEK